MRSSWARMVSSAVISAALLWCQQQQPPVGLPPPPRPSLQPLYIPQPVFPQPPPAPQAATPAANQPATQPAAAPAQVAPTPQGALSFRNFYNASLVEVIEILAQRLKINYILDPRIKGSVTINTYGEIRPVDIR